MSPPRPQFVFLNRCGSAKFSCYNFAMLISRRRAFSFSHFTLYVMLLALALRALVPAGFMPDVGALRDGRLEMTFCTSGDIKTITVDTHDVYSGHHGHDGAPASDDAPNQQSQSNDCPFSVLSTLPAMPTMALALVGLPLLLAPIQPVLRAAPLPVVLSQGPPLGSRAPPFHLV
jgi:hypothetical protein